MKKDKNEKGQMNLTDIHDDPVLNEAGFKPTDDKEQVEIREEFKETEENQKKIDNINLEINELKKKIDDMNNFIGSLKKIYDGKRLEIENKEKNINSTINKAVSEVLRKLSDEVLEEKENRLKERKEEYITNITDDSKNLYWNNFFKTKTDKEVMSLKELAYEGKYDNYNITTTLGQYLKANGISKTWLSTQSGVNRVTLTNLINKPNTVTLLNAYKICSVLGEPVDKMFPFIELIEQNEK